MEALLLYRRLWTFGEDANKIAYDQTLPASIRAIACYLSHDYANCQKLYSEYADAVAGSKDVFWSEVKLMLRYRQTKELNTLQKDTEELLSLWKDSIFGRILLATIHAQQRRYGEATFICETILSDNPDSLIVLPALLAIYVVAGKIERARQIWRKGVHLISGLKDWRKRIRWHVAFFIYGFRLFLERSILLGGVMFVVGSMLPLWVSFSMLFIITGALVLIRLFSQLARDRLAVLVSTRLILIEVLGWLIGYGTKSLFVFLERL
jgi:tetratricopeptide (TPR) repeat protein